VVLSLSSKKTGQRGAAAAKGIKKSAQGLRCFVTHAVELAHYLTNTSLITASTGKNLPPETVCNPDTQLLPIFYRFV
jgi:hypothetical protein